MSPEGMFWTACRLLVTAYLSAHTHVCAHARHIDHDDCPGVYDSTLAVHLGPNLVPPVSNFGNTEVLGNANVK